MSFLLVSIAVCAAASAVLSFGPTGMSVAINRAMESIPENAPDSERLRHLQQSVQRQSQRHSQVAYAAIISSGIALMLASRASILANQMKNDEQKNSEAQQAASEGHPEAGRPRA